jgi:polysaccharide biosynthesis/export protein
LSLRAVLWICAALVMTGLSGGLMNAQGADEYRIGTGDVLNVSVWERPDLTRSVAVRQSGNITFPPLGDVLTVGKTGAELARLLEEKLNEFMRSPAQVTVEVSSFNSQYITVSGAVTTSGRYSYEHLPGVVDVLGATGALGPNGDLSNVQIFRTENGKSNNIRVDVSAALKNGTFDALPALQPGDVIYVPAIAGNVGSDANVAYISGVVSRPGAYSVGAGLDLIKVLALAGGPVPGADMENVKIMGHEGAGTFIATVDLRRYLDRGVSGFTVRPGDSILISQIHGSGLKGAWGITQQALVVSRDLLNLALIRDVARRN